MANEFEDGVVGDQHTEFAGPAAQGVPVQVLKRKGAINLYYTAVGALAAVVVLVPVFTIFSVMPEQVWGGWNICIGGLIALVGAQGASQ